MLAGIIRYVSSANLHIEFPAVAVFKSPAVTTYAARPIAGPWLMLAVMPSSDDCWFLKTVQ